MHTCQKPASSMPSRTTARRSDPQGERKITPAQILNILPFSGKSQKYDGSTCARKGVVKRTNRERTVTVEPNCSELLALHNVDKEREREKVCVCVTYTRGASELAGDGVGAGTAKQDQIAVLSSCYVHLRDSTTKPCTCTCTCTCCCHCNNNCMRSASYVRSTAESGSRRGAKLP
jgi:hypothetical protein